jgi:CheY-like chemotaxis protein
MVHAITIANNGKETVAQFQEKEFDLVLMDVQMPIISGVEATAEIRKSYPWPDFFEIPQYHITKR